VLLVVVVDDVRMAGVREAARHRAAEMTEADEPDPFRIGVHPPALPASAARGSPKRAIADVPVRVPAVG
jgi:hypothetical protein